MLAAKGVREQLAGRLSECKGARRQYSDMLDEVSLANPLSNANDAAGIATYCSFVPPHRWACDDPSMRFMLNAGAGASGSPGVRAAAAALAASDGRRPEAKPAAGNALAPVELDAAFVQRGIDLFALRENIFMLFNGAAARTFQNWRAITASKKSALLEQRADRALSPPQGVPAASRSTRASRRRSFSFQG